MTAPAYDPDTTPVVFDVYVTPWNAGTYATICPGNAVDPRDPSFTHVGQVDGPTLFGSSGLGKANPCPINWTAGPDTPFGYDTRYSALFEGIDPTGGHVRACAADITFQQAGPDADVSRDAFGVRAYWYYEPPAS